MGGMGGATRLPLVRAVRHSFVAKHVLPQEPAHPHRMEQRSVSRAPFRGAASGTSSYPVAARRPAASEQPAICQGTVAVTRLRSLTPRGRKDLRLRSLTPVRGREGELVLPVSSGMVRDPLWSKVSAQELRSQTRSFDICL